MKILACLLRPDSGEATVDGMDIATRGDDIRRVIGYMPDFLGVYDDLTVDEYLQFFAAAFKIPRKQRMRIVDEVITLTDLKEKRHAMVDSLSRGMQQRLGVARVLIHDPKVLLLDEPASGLDPRARIEMRSLLLELGRMGKTLMVSSHILSELAEMCSSIGIIERGTLHYSGSIAEAFERTRRISAVSERIRVRLSPDGTDLATIRPRLEIHEAVKRVVEVDGAPLECVVELREGRFGHHFLIELLMAGGGRIDLFQPEEVKLEDAFLKLTTGALQ
jgi:ABC-2 type transport system ATP-binding protein